MAKKPNYGFEKRQKELAKKKKKEAKLQKKQERKDTDEPDGLSPDADTETPHEAPLDGGLNPDPQS